VRVKGSYYKLFTLYLKFLTLVPRVEILSSSASEEEALTLIAKEFQLYLNPADLVTFILIRPTLVIFHNCYIITIIIKGKSPYETKIS